MLLKFAVIIVGGHTGGVTVPVGVKVGVDVIVPVEVGVGVNVDVEVIVEVGVVLPAAVGVAVDVGVAVEVTARLRKTTIVCEEAVPSTMVTIALPPPRFLLTKRPAGIV